MSKSGIITIPLHIGDFLGGTMHMDTLEKGAYLMLILAHYQIGIEGLPNNNKKLSRIAGVTLKVWDRICPVLREKFIVTDHFWEHKKVIEVIRKVEYISSQNSYKALKRYNSGVATADPLISQPKPKPKPIEKEDTIVSSKKKPKPKKPDDVSETVWDDFLTARKAKNAPVTTTVISRLKIEAGLLGWTLEQVIAEMCARGWQGFKAQWIIEEQQRKNHATNRTSREQRINAALGRAWVDTEQSDGREKTPLVGHSQTKLLDVQPVREITRRS